MRLHFIFHNIEPFAHSEYLLSVKVRAYFHLFLGFLAEYQQLAQPQLVKMDDESLASVILNQNLAS